MLKFIPLLCGLVGLLFSVIYYSWVVKVGKGNASSDNLIQNSANNNSLFYRKDWMTIIIVVIVLSVVIGISTDWISSSLYFYGSLSAVLVELIASSMLTKSKKKFINFVGEDSILFKIGYRSGIAAGMLIVSLALLTLGAIFIPFNMDTAISCIACYGFGVATIALFNETNFIATADLYVSFVTTIMSAIIISKLAVNTSHITSTFTLKTAASFPLIIAGIGIIVCLIGSFFVRRNEKGNINLRINVGTYVSSFLLIFASIYLSSVMLQSYLYGVAISLGIICGLITGISSVNKTSLLAVVSFAAAFILAYKFIGVVGLVLIGVGFLSIAPILIATTAYGLVTESDNNVVLTADGYATCASAFSVMALFIAFIQAANLSSVNIYDPNVLVGLFAGVMMPIVYASIFARKDDWNHNFDFIMRLTSFIIPGIVGILFGIESLAAFLCGLISAGMVTSLVFANMGITFDDREGNTISVCASINTIIKYMTAFTLVFIPVFTQFGGLLY